MGERVVTSVGSDLQSQVFEWAKATFHPWLLIVLTLLVLVAWRGPALLEAAAKWVETRTASRREKAERARAKRSESSISALDAQSLMDWMAELDGRIEALERRLDTDVEARLEFEGPASVILMVENRSDSATCSSLDGRVTHRDGVAVDPVRVSGLGVDLGPHEQTRVDWPDEAGAGATYVVRLTWKDEERDRYMDRDVLLRHPAS